MKKSLSTLLLVIGIGVFMFGSHVANQAAQGEQKIAQAEQNEQGHRPVLGPVRRRANENASATAQQKIGAAGQRVAKSQVTANWLHGVGIVLFVVGIGGFICCCSYKKRR